ncbi:PDIL2-2 [Symbiodinium natans]|uniref:PDIL2-2 protein n=1 Tax=Symbiodinium natans TaxID=878477 RepID=A0A812IAJ1_9DINO|nr:PDIL2-2 [Symbiodinium natans]
MAVPGPGVLFGVTLLVAQAQQAYAEEKSLVVNLTDSNFQELVARGENRPWVVKFYAPWCGHCKMLAPTWEQLANKLDGQVNVAKVDCTESQFVANMFDVHGYPTLKLISQGRVCPVCISMSLRAASIRRCHIVTGRS